MTNKKVTVIEPRSTISLKDLIEIWEYRELLITLVLRDVKVRYKQTVIGVVWALIQPFTSMIVFSFFFGKLANMPSDNIPYPVFSYAGLTLWTYFQTALSAGSNSLVNQQHLISKVFFPRLILPISTTMTPVVDYGIALSLVFLILAYFQIVPSLGILLVPIILLMTWILATGLSFWLSSINVKFRDVKFVLPFFMQLLVFISPVIYPVSVAGRYEFLVRLNPMSGYLEAHRAMILGHKAIPYDYLIVSILITLIIFFSGMYYFKKVERHFADVV